MANFVLDNFVVSIDDGKIIDYIRKNYDPEKIFTFEELHDWAVCNRFVYEGKPKNIKKDMTIKKSENPEIVHKYLDEWYFWDETYSERYGPYESEEEAIRKLDQYYHECIEGNTEWKT